MRTRRVWASSAQPTAILKGAMMKKNDLIAALKALPGNPEVFIDGIAVDGVEIAHGRIKRSMFGDTFRVMPDKPRDEAVVFTKGVELSTGEWVQRPL